MDVEIFGYILAPFRGPLSTRGSGRGCPVVLSCIVFARESRKGGLVEEVSFVDGGPFAKGPFFLRDRAVF